MILAQPDPRQVRNDVFKRIIGGVQNSGSIQKIAQQIIDELSEDLILVDDPRERRRLIRDTYHRIENTHKIRKFHYVYASPERNKSVSQVINEVLFRYRTKYARYF